MMRSSPLIRRRPNGSGGVRHTNEIAHEIGHAIADEIVPTPPQPSAEQHKDNTKNNTRALLSSCVLTVSLLLQSHVQEHLNREPLFRAHSSSVLSLCVPLAALIAGVARNGIAGCGGTAPRRAPLRAHVVLGLLLWGSFFLSAVGPLHLPMPIFLAAKSVKILPTMVIAALWLRKRFKATDWLAAALSALGLILCLTGGSGGDAARGSVAAALRRNERYYVPSAFGVTVMLGALACDGGAANAQEAIMSHFAAPAAELAAYTYGVATAASLVHGLGWGSLREGFVSLVNNSNAAAAVVAYAFASLGATSATVDLIAHLGASSCMFVSSLAKALVILSSVCLSEQFTTSKKQALGIFLVFSAASLAVIARTRGAEWIERAATGIIIADADADAGARAGARAGAGGGVDLVGKAKVKANVTSSEANSALEATPSATRIDMGGGRDGIRRRGAAGAGAGAAPTTPTTPPRSIVASRSEVALAPAIPISALATLRSESSRALSAMTSVVFGVDRPPIRAEQLTPPLVRTRGSTRDILSQHQQG